MWRRTGASGGVRRCLRRHPRRDRLEGLASQRTWLFVGPSFSDPDLTTLRQLLDLGIEHVAGDHSRLPDVLRYLARPKPSAPMVPVAGARAEPASASSSSSSTVLLPWERAYLGARRPIWQQGRHDVLAAKGFEVSLAARGPSSRPLPAAA